MEDNYIEIIDKKFTYKDNSGWYRDKNNGIEYYKYELKENPIAIIFDTFVKSNKFESNVCLIISKDIKSVPYESNFLNVLCGKSVYRINENNIKRVFDRINK